MARTTDATERSTHHSAAICEALEPRLLLDGSMPGQELKELFPGPVIAVDIDVSDQMTEPTGTITVDSGDIVSILSKYVKTGSNGADYTYSTPNNWIYSGITLSGATTNALITSVYYSWNVDSNYITDIDHYLDVSDVDGTHWDSTKATNMSVTGDDWVLWPFIDDGYSQTSAQGRWVYPPSTVQVNGTWWFNIADTYNDANNLYDKGRLDSWSITINYVTRDLRGYWCTVPSSIGWGDTFTVHGRVQNYGSGAVTPTFTQRFYLSNDANWGDADDVYLGYYTHSANVPASGYGPDFYKTLTLPSTIPSGYSATGTYRIGMKTDYYNNILEYNETNNGPGDYGESYDWDTFTIKPKYDLAGYDCFVPSSIRWGGSFTLQGEVRNLQYSAVTPTFTQKFYLSNDATWGDADDYYLGYYTHTANVPGYGYAGNFYKTLTLPSTIPAGYSGSGTYRIGMKTDANSNIGETNEANNGPGDYGMTWDWDSFNIEIRRDLAGLWCNAPASIGWGDTFTLTAQVRNLQYSNVTPSFYQKFYLSNDQVWGDADDVYLGYYYHTADVPGNGNGPSWNQSLALPSTIPGGYSATGTYYIGMKTDANGNIAETNETNNGPGDYGQTWDWDSFTIKPKYDLVGFDCVVPTSIPWGGAFTLQGQVRNLQYSLVTATFTQRFYLSNDSIWGDADDVYLGYYSHTANVPGYGYGPDFTKVLTLPSAIPSGYSGIGTYRIGMRTDFYNNIAETNETNNGPGDFAQHRDWDSFAVEIRRDLIGYDCYVPPSIPWGGTFTLQGQVRNLQYSAVTPTFTQRFYLSNDAIWGDSDDFYLGAYTHTADVPGYGFAPDFTKLLTLPSTIPAGYSGIGTYRIGMQTDGLGNIAETIETNNGPGDYAMGWDWDEFAIVIRRDLRGWDCFVPPSILWGSTFTLQGQVKNLQYSAVTPTFYQKFYLSNDTIWGDADDVYLGAYTHAADVPGYGNGPDFNKVLALPGIVPAGYSGGGPFYIGMKTDSNNNIAETIETNNGPGDYAITYDWDSFQAVMVSIAATDSTAKELLMNTGKFTVTRTGPLGSPLTVNYAIGGTAANGVDYNLLTSPVTIPAGAPSAPITVTPIDDSLVEGTETVIATLTAGSGYNIGSPVSAAVWIYDDDVAALTVSASPSTFSEAAGPGASTGTVTRTGPTSSALTVNLASNDTTEATVPATVIIPIGQPSATFPINAVDDSIIDGIQTVTITASALGLTPVNTTVNVIDDDVAALIVSASPSTFSEGAGAGASTGTVTRTGPASSALTVNLSSNDTTEATVPATVTIPIGQPSVTFPINAVDDLIFDSTQIVTIAASALGLTGGNTTVNVTDNEQPVLTVSASPSTFTEADGAGASTGTVSRTGPTTAALKVTLASNDTTEATVPVFVMIPVGQPSATFPINAVDDVIIDGTQTVTIAASALGVIGGSTPVTVTDEDVGNEIDAEIRLVGSPFASDHMPDVGFASYNSMTSILVGSTYTAEVWLRDVGTIRGISGGSVDITYTTANADATAINHGSVYTTLPTGAIFEAQGLVDNIGGATFNLGEGTTQWVRFAYVTLNCTALGNVVFVLGHDLAPAPPGTANPQFAESGAGSIAWIDINWTGTPHTVQQKIGEVDVWLVPRIVVTGSDLSVPQPVPDRDPFWQGEDNLPAPGPGPGGDHTPHFEVPADMTLAEAQAGDYYVEVWVRSDQANPVAISGGSVNVTFDPDYAEALAVDHGSVFTMLPITNINNVTGVVSIGGGTLTTDKGDDEFVCLGRILFRGEAPVDEVNHEWGPYDMALGVTAGPSSFALVGVGNVGADFQAVPSVDIRANIYDIDDSGQVDFGDFSFFVPAFLGTVGDPEPPYLWWADFDQSGGVDFGDFSYFVTAFLKPFCNPTIAYPTWWHNTYVTKIAPAVLAVLPAALDDLSVAAPAVTATPASDASQTAAQPASGTASPTTAPAENDAPSEPASTQTAVTAAGEQADSEDDSAAELVETPVPDALEEADALAPTA